MMTSTVDPNEPRLTDYALGELDAATRAEVEQLLAASPELQSELADIRSLADSLRSELARESVVALTADQRSQLAQQMTAVEAPMLLAASATKPRRKWTARHWLLAGAETSAVVLFMVIVWPFLPSHRTDQSWPLVNSLSQRGNGYVESGQVCCDTSPSVDTNWNESSEAVVEQATSAGDGIRSGSELAGLSNSSELKSESMLNLRGDSTALPILDNGQHDSSTTGDRKPGDINFENAASGRMSSAAKSALVRSSGGNSAKPSPKFLPVEVAPVKSKNGDLIRNVAENERKVNDGRLHFVEGELEQLHAAVAGRRGDGKYQNLDVFPEPSASPDPQTNEAYEAPAENVFVTPGQQPLSTFSIDVDSASYANVRRFLTQGQRPPADAVRIEEMINYFTYDYPPPKDGEPFSVTADAAPCPWKREHYLARIALKARTIDKAKRPPTNLVFLLDVSGSMQAANKLPLVKQAMTLLAEELNERDRIAIVTYAGNAGVQLASTPGNDQVRIMESIEALQAGGSTNGAAGINLAYEQALQNFNDEGENRVILCTDGDFNVGVSSDEQLVQLIQQQAKSKVFLSIFGFGMGNLKDAKLEKLADKGNGHYGYIDDLKEARRVFNEELVGTLYTIAKDVKIQVEFNPLTVGAYRLIGYENRALAARDFNDDAKDAGEIGAGHTVTALYEIVPRAQWPKAQAVDPLKYGNAAKEPAPAVAPPNPNIPAEVADDLFTVKLRYKQPTADTSVKTIDFVVDDIAGKNIVPSADFQWAASVAAFGMQLKHSAFAGQWTLNDVLESAQGAKGADSNGRRREFLDLIQTARRLNP
jgi:secreted protein with Ig-like and vWFA domain